MLKKFSFSFAKFEVDNLIEILSLVSQSPSMESFALIGLKIKVNSDNGSMIDLFAQNEKQFLKLIEEIVTLFKDKPMKQLML